MDSLVTKPWHTANFCNIAGALRWQAERRPGATALHCPPTRHIAPKRFTSCTYIEFSELTDVYARGLEDLGIEAGDRVVMVVEPGLKFLTLFTALARVGAVPVLISPAMPPEVISQCINETEPKAYIGSAKANVQRKLKGWGKASCEYAISTGRSIPGVAIGLKSLHKLGMNDTREVFHHSRPDDPAAMVFTSGWGGEPKCVVYSHAHFSAQADIFTETFDLSAGEISISTDPLFSVLDAALGLTTVFVDVDDAQPTQVDAKRLVQAIESYKVNNIFLSPAMLKTLSHYVKQEKVKLPIVRRLITFGASPRLEVIARLENALHDEARIHAPYGSAECFPVSSVTNHDVDSTLEEMMESGEGVCVGQAVAACEVKIIAASNRPLGSIEDVTVLPPGMVGEIIVSGPNCSDKYWRSEANEELATIRDVDDKHWHRMGDMGSIDGMGRLWYCGRISQRIDTGKERLYPDQAEALFNQHPDVRHTALVGVGDSGRQLPVLCAELRTKLRPADVERVHFDLLQLAQSCALTHSVRTVLFHPGFPVDARNAAIIPRAALSQWAAGMVKA